MSSYTDAHFICEHAGKFADSHTMRSGSDAAANIEDDEGFAEEGARKH